MPEVFHPNYYQVPILLIISITFISHHERAKLNKICIKMQEIMLNEKKASTEEAYSR